MDNVLEALLSTMPTADGHDEEFEELWTRVFTTGPRETTQPLGPIVPYSAANGKSPPRDVPTRAGISTNRRVPKVGTLIQRSTTTNARKLQALMETPSPPPLRKNQRAARPTSRPQVTREKKTRQVLTDLFGGSLSDLSDDDQPADAPPEQKPTLGTEPTTAVTSTRPTIPPPVIITVSGINIPVPYHAIHVSRRYKARVENRRFALRFDRAGKLRTHREL